MGFCLVTNTKLIWWPSVLGALSFLTVTSKQPGYTVNQLHGKISISEVNLLPRVLLPTPVGPRRTILGDGRVSVVQPQSSVSPLSKLARRMQRETRVWNKTTKRSLANQICQNWGLFSYFSGDQGGLKNPEYLQKIFYGISSSHLPHLHISGSSVLI